VKELVVVSGKGGTGKTSLVASLAALNGELVLADCDVDAADLHLISAPSTVYREQFTGGVRATIDGDRCTACGVCEDLCRFDAISTREADDKGTMAVPTVDAVACEGCGVCAWFCEEGAIEMIPQVCGEWYLSDTRFGPMVHARLFPAAESSGKLVSLVRAQARTTAETRNLDLVLIDGSPGIGCPVIASVTGADLVVVVIEATRSGLHDLDRVVRLTEHFRVPAMLVVNRFDINRTVTEEAEALARDRGVDLAGRIRYDATVTEAQFRGLSVVEHTTVGASADIARVWRSISAAPALQDRVQPHRSTLRRPDPDREAADASRCGH
jgi:MinD superfamily P-loop ATPase